MDLHAPIFVAGHRGLVGAALVRRLEALGCTDLRLATRGELDLTDQAAVRDWFAAQRPAYVFLAAARVGGIHANDTYPAEFIYQNLAIELNVIDAAYHSGVRKLQFLGSSCIYPRLAPQPMTEDALLSGPLEPTNEWYAIAKIAGIKLCQAYRRQYGFDAISLMPTNLYGPGDNFDLNNSHVLPALLRRFDEATASNVPDITLWGSGTPRREFLHVDDLADAAVYLMQHYSAPDIINVGVGTDVSIAELADLVARATGYRGTIRWDTARPDGPPRKLLDTRRLTDLGWRPRIALADGIADTLAWYRAQGSALRGMASETA